MDKKNSHHKQKIIITFAIVFLTSMIVGGVVGLVQTALAAQGTQPVAHPPSQEGAPPADGYQGSAVCATCHTGINDVWKETRHAQAFSSPIFQRDWSDLGKQTNCLECHTTGFDPVTGKYVQEGVSCESCHGPLVAGHPANPMSIQPNAEVCAKCHKTTTDEWRASKHGQEGIECKSCHNPHSQTPKASSITELCSNCHKDNGSSFTHGTHAQAGLECSNCHMYSKPRTEDPIEGLVATGHTFTVGSDACVGCHQDTVHSRDEIVKLSGEVTELKTADIDTLQKTVQDQQEKITTLESQSTIRLYTGLAQGAIIGLIIGCVAAWIVSQRIRVIEVGE